jgi:hypothetical protein
MPKTIKTKVLLGWMPQQEAIKTLSNCVFPEPMSQERMIELWQGYRAKVEALNRIYQPPTQEKMSFAEKSRVRKFLHKAKGLPIGRYIVRALKVNPSQLLIHQFMVVTERAESYGNKMMNATVRARYCLGIGMDERHKIVEVRNGAKTILRLPHYEFEVSARPGGFNISEMGRFISAVDANGRLLLWAGYHRTYAVFDQMTPDADGMAPLVILMKDVRDADRLLGAASDRPLVRDDLLREIPPVFADFFDADLFMEVDLLKQRREVHIEPVGTLINATTCFVNDET